MIIEQKKTDCYPGNYVRFVSHIPDYLEKCHSLNMCAI